MAQENDIVLIYIEDKPLAFARIESILSDAKPDWYHVKLLFLQVPLQVVTWILRDTYINGETFTMGGKKMSLEKVVWPRDNQSPQEQNSEPIPDGPKEKATKPNRSKIISLADLKKK